MNPTHRIATLVLDEGRVLRRKPEIEQERQAAIDDLLRENSFGVAEVAGPYHLTLSISENRLIFGIRPEAGGEAVPVSLPLSPLRSIVRDYFIICESYFKAAELSDPYKIEAIDMGRRGVHNEGSELLLKLLSGKIELDFATARRLFTLVCVLHIR